LQPNPESLPAQPEAAAAVVKRAGFAAQGISNFSQRPGSKVAIPFPFLE